MEVYVKNTTTKKVASQIIEYSSNFDNCIKNIESILDSVNSVWNGEDALKYIKVMREKYIPELENIHEFLNEYGNYLNKIPEVYDLLDETYASKNIEV